MNEIKHYDDLMEASLPAGEYVLVNSVWLAMMGIRENGDLDILLSSKLWKSRFKNFKTDQSFGMPGTNSRKLRVHPMEGGNYVTMTDLESNDDAIYKHKVVVNNIPLIEPKFYFQYLMVRRKKFTLKFSNVPWWKRFELINPGYKKLKKKVLKDNTTLNQIKNYFSKLQHDNGQLREISQQQWGFKHPALSEIFHRRNDEKI